MPKYILSTMTGDNAYTFYDKGPAGGLPVEKKRVYVYGGANLPSADIPFGLQGKDDQGVPMWTPRGIVTKVTDEIFEELKEHPIFKLHMQNGHIEIVDQSASESHYAVEKAVRNMESSDGAAQLTPENSKAKLGKTAPKVRTGKADDEDVDTPKKRIKD